MLTNKTVQEDTQTKYNSKKETAQNTAKQNYPVQLPHTKVSIETRSAYCTMLSSQINLRTLKCDSALH